jgi:ketosteroid isomerase-like protein
MTDLDRVSTWIDDYVRAWNSNDPDDIGALFTEEAEYYTEPYHPPWLGREHIVEQWLENRDEPGETTFEWRPVVVTDEVAVVQGTTVYPGRTYSNMWVIQLDADGRCRHFTEWWMKHDDAAVG